jgi:hypothetical protein
MQPCHQCWQRGRQANPTIEGEASTRGGKTYYVPHTEAEYTCPHPKRNLRILIDRWQAEQDPLEKELLSSEFGIKRASILLKLSSLHFPRSFPMDLMHCVLTNITRNFYKNLWGGKAYSDTLKTAKKHAGDDSNTPPQLAIPPIYGISARQWLELSDLLEDARATVPSQHGQAPRRLDKYWKGYKAMEWEAFLIRDGPILLLSLGAEFTPFYDNFMMLRRLYLLARCRKLNLANIEEIYRTAIAFVKGFEDLYYKQRPERISVCLINYHSLLHLGTYSLTFEPH